jgi:hypothetical protein
MEHLYGLKGVCVKIFANQYRFFYNIIRDCYNMAANLVGMEKIEELPGAGPD